MARVSFRKSPADPLAAIPLGTDLAAIAVDRCLRRIMRRDESRAVAAKSAPTGRSHRHLRLRFRRASASDCARASQSPFAPPLPAPGAPMAASLRPNRARPLGPTSSSSALRAPWRDRRTAGTRPARTRRALPDRSSTAARRRSRSPPSARWHRCPSRRTSAARPAGQRARAVRADDRFRRCPWPLTPRYARTGSVYTSDRAIRYAAVQHRPGLPMFLYQYHELLRAWMAPATFWAEAGSRTFSAPGSWLSSLPGAQRVAAGYELFYRL